MERARIRCAKGRLVSLLPSEPRLATGIRLCTRFVAISSALVPSLRYHGLHYDRRRLAASRRRDETLNSFGRTFLHVNLAFRSLAGALPHGSMIHAHWPRSFQGACRILHLFNQFESVQTKRNPLKCSISHRAIRR